MLRNETVEKENRKSKNIIIVIFQRFGMEGENLKLSV